MALTTLIKKGLELFGVPRKENDYIFREYDLGIARTDVALGIAGSSLTIKKLTGEASIKFNDTAKDSIPLAEKEIYDIEFTEIFLTNTAQAGLILQIYVGRRT